MDGENRAIAGSARSSATTSSPPPPFLSKTYDMVDDRSTDSVVSWTSGGNSFVVWQPHEFTSDLLPKYFKHSNLSSFIRQLNTYKFRKVDPDRYEFANEGFLRGQRHLLKSISRRKSGQVHGPPQPPEVQSTSAGSCVEVASFGLEEDVESLKKDKNVLMQELVRLRQQQQATDHQLQTAGQRVHLMEQRQQQMMSFLAKAMQSPGFLAQLVQQQSDTNRRLSGVNKKRRLPKQEEEILVGKLGSVHGQIVKYQPLMNEAAKAMLREILNINASVRLEPSISSASGFLIDNSPSLSSIVECGSSPSRMSGLTLSEVLPTSSQAFAESGSLFNHPSAVTQSSPVAASTSSTVTQFPELDVLDSQEGTVLPDYCQIQGVIQESTAEVPDMRFNGSETEAMDYMNMMPGFVDRPIVSAPDELSSSTDVDVLLDETDIPKLPGINDVFWEQFLPASPHDGDTDDISSTVEGVVAKEQELWAGRASGWDSTQHMAHLTEHMGLLASGSKPG
ncbi:hypothetical protein RJ640_028397 [Escallonia rubra]|uniref:Heat stress transcription factor n=1 Tax=Escallonia rubra TaxID=112253 RepID=A0AA88U6C8_9ASTE|nr:hypothetical protein RJ640_028397 [Escallonia rubra]